MSHHLVNRNRFDTRNAPRVNGCRSNMAVFIRDGRTILELSSPFDDSWQIALSPEEVQGLMYLLSKTRSIRNG